jgi:DNA-binding PadR family transcriptional regulator
MLILKAISPSPLHGGGILLRIQQMSKELWKSSRDLYVPHFTGSNFTGGLQPNRESERRRSAGLYRLTAAGKSGLQSESERWNQMTAVIAGILQATPEEL